jgi:xanthine dehydrogenase molybdopterin-binding subunit B
VATAKDVPHNLCGFYGDHPVLAENEIRFRGQVIAAVAAIDEDAAMEALSNVKIDLEELTPIFDPRRL